jgi:hypothetical protein
MAQHSSVVATKRTASTTINDQTHKNASPNTETVQNSSPSISAKIGLRDRNTATDLDPAALAARSFDDNLNLNPSDIQTTDHACKCLSTGQYLPDDAHISAATLANVILLVLNYNKTIKGLAVNHLRSVAILLGAADTDDIVSQVTSRMAASQDELHERMNTAITKMSDTTRLLEKTVEAANNRIDVMARQAEQTHEGCTSTAMDVDKVLDDIRSHKEDLDKHITRLAAQSTPATPAPAAATTYATAHLNTPQHTGAASKATADKLLILVDLKGEAATEATKLSEKELVLRANVAVDQMGIGAADKPTEYIFTGAKKLREGGILY